MSSTSPPGASPLSECSTDLEILSLYSPRYCLYIYIDRCCVVLCCSNRLPYTGCGKENTDLYVLLEVERRYLSLERDAFPPLVALVSQVVLYCLLLLPLSFQGAKNSIVHSDDYC